MLYLCKNMQGCVLGYTQSDEITLILTDYKKLTSNAFFDYEVQKICSIAASMASTQFNKIFQKKVESYDENFHEKWNVTDKERKYILTLWNAVEAGAMFDARCFNIPKEEVTNLIFWRQQDASKNSVSMAARAYFSHSEVHEKTSSQMQEMLFSVHGINWNDYPTDCKRGACCIKGEKGWEIDKEIPIFKGENRAYIENRINFSELKKAYEEELKEVVEVAENDEELEEFEVELVRVEKVKVKAKDAEDAKIRAMIETDSDDEYWDEIEVVNGDQGDMDL